MLDENYIDRVFKEFSLALEKEGAPLPIVSQIALGDNAPYKVLVSTVLSLRTRDSATAIASEKLFKIASDIYQLDSLDLETLENAIKASGFYKRKAQQLKQIARIIIEEYNGKIPCDMDKLMALPGVGLKTASLVLNLGFDSDAICVDCHVHQICNRLGWIKTKTPEESEKELRKILPKRFWISLNELLVRYGQHICTSISPWCSKCPECNVCPKIGVARSR